MSAPEILAICREATARIAAGDPVAGEALLAGPLARSPHDPNLLYVAGNCALARGDERAALDRYERSAAAAPTFVAALANLGFVLRTRQRIDEARAVLRRAVTIEPDHVTAWMNLVSCHVNEGDPAAGEAVAREALVRHPSDATLRWNLALLLLEQGIWQEGWREYRHRFATPVVSLPDCVLGLRRLESPDDLAAGDVVLCHGEQGLGDEILFAGTLGDFVADAGRRGAEVVLDPNPRLAGVFARNFPLRQRAAGSRSPSRPPDWFIPIGDLPGFYRTSDGSFPRRRGYLEADPQAVATLRGLLAAGTNRPLVGIAWRGGSSYTHAVHRTIPLDAWLPLLRHDAVFVSLAYHDDADELDSLRAAYGITILGLPEITRARDYERTFELVAALDLVVTVPTSVHHVAGAVGTRCWLLMDERAAWRECARDDAIPWYPLTHHRFKKSRSEPDWRSTLDRAAEALAGVMRGMKTCAPPIH